MNKSIKRKWVELALAAVVGLSPVTAWAQWIVLSEGASFSNVQNFEISPDGERVVYRQDARMDNLNELWSVPIGGGTPELLTLGISVANMKISPNGIHVVYRRNSFPRQIYRTALAGNSGQTQLSTMLPSGDTDYFFEISPNSQRVVYSAVVAVRELYSTPIAGGAAVKLNGALVSGGEVEDFFLVSPDSSRVVYRADQDSDDVLELYSVPIAGGTPTKLNGALVTGGDVGVFGDLTFAISADSSRVVYRADQDTDEVFELYSVPIGGGTAVKLNGPLAAGVKVTSFSITPNGSRVIYASVNPGLTSELYSVPIGGGTAVKLDDDQDDRVCGFFVVPDSSRVVYINCAPPPDVYSVPVAGGAAPIKLSGTFVPPSTDALASLRISPDGNWVVYKLLASQEGFKASPAGPALSANLAWGQQLDPEPGGDGIDYKFGPGSQYLVILGSKRDEIPRVERLWQVPLGDLPNLTPRELIPATDFVAGDGVSFFKIGPDGSVVYLARQRFPGVTELYSIPGVLFSDGFE